MMYAGQQNKAYHLAFKRYLIISSGNEIDKNKNPAHMYFTINLSSTNEPRIPRYGMISVRPRHWTVRQFLNQPMFMDVCMQMHRSMITWISTAKHRYMMICMVACLAVLTLP